MIDLASAIGLFAAGAAVAAMYLGLLWASVRLLARGGSLSAYFLLAAARGGLVLGSLWLAITLGIGASGILIGLAGYIALRVCVIRMTEFQARKDA